MIHSYGQPEVDKGLKWSKSAAQTFGELLSFRKDPFRLKTTLNGNLECDLTVLPFFKGGGGRLGKPEKAWSLLAFRDD